MSAQPRVGERMMAVTVHLAEAVAWAKRMEAALEQIADGVEDYDDRPDRLSPDDVVRIARRALDPAEWERVR
jgi:hypothetical protein